MSEEVSLLFKAVLLLINDAIAMDWPDKWALDQIKYEMRELLTRRAEEKDND